MNCAFRVGDLVALYLPRYLYNRLDCVQILMLADVKSRVKFLISLIIMIIIFFYVPKHKHLIYITLKVYLDSQHGHSTITVNVVYLQLLNIQYKKIV